MQPYKLSSCSTTPNLMRLLKSCVVLGLAFFIGYCRWKQSADETVKLCLCYEFPLSSAPFLTVVLKEAECHHFNTLADELNISRVIPIIRWVPCPRFLRLTVQGGAIYMAKTKYFALINILMRLTILVWSR